MGLVLSAAVAGIVVFLAAAVNGDEPVIWFSTQESFTATAGPYAGQEITDGDLLATTGEVIAKNDYLVRNFSPEPPPPNYGLDAIHVRSSGEILFSLEGGFWDEQLAVQVGPGDVLSDTGAILMTNPQLLKNFHPMPPVLADYALDALHRATSSEMWFSIGENFYDETLGTTVGDGDLLSDAGTIVRTNSDLLKNFHPMPPVLADYGLDAVHRASSRELWFSVKESFFDETLGVTITGGDLLSDTGTLVKRNRDLLAPFFGGAGNVPEDYGLDAVWVVPEPATMGLWALGVGLWVRRRRSTVLSPRPSGF